MNKVKKEAVPESRRVRSAPTATARKRKSKINAAEVLKQEKKWA